MKNVLVIVDMQNDFIDGSLGNQHGAEVTKNVILEVESKKYDYIALTRDTHFDNYMNTLEGKNLPVPHCVYGSEGWEVKKEIMTAVENSGIHYKLFDKKTFGTFDLAKEFDLYENELESITVVGLCTDICVVSNALILRAEFPNVPMYVVDKACGGTTDENHKAAIDVMKSCQIYSK